jgi:hypothetical protein
MTRISRESESVLLDGLEQALRSTLPSTWRLEARRQPLRGHDHGYDAGVTVEAPDGSRVLILVQAKQTLSPAQIPRLARKLEVGIRERQGDPVDSISAMIITNFASERSRELLKRAGIGWYDRTGNLRLRAERPSIYVERAGADRNPESDPSDRRLKSLKGPGAARIVRALLDGAADTRVRALATSADVGAATSARVLQYLDSEGLVERDERASVKHVHKRSMVHAWARDYGFSTTNHATPVLSPRGVPWLIEQLTEKRLPHVLAGSAALRHHLPESATAVTPLSLLAVYSEEVPRLKRELRLRDSDRGANVLLLEPFDPVVVRGASEDEGHWYTAPSQTVVDLLTSPGRGPEEAAQLLEILGAQDEEWTL